MTNATSESGAPPGESQILSSLRRVAQREALDSMMILGAHPQATPEVRALTLDHLARLRVTLGRRVGKDQAAAALVRQAERDLTKYLENPEHMT